MQFSWRQAISAAILFVGVATATKYEHSPFESGSAMTSVVIADRCSAGISAPTRAPGRAARLADCAALNQWTVTPPSSVVTETIRSQFVDYTATSTETLIITATTTPTAAPRAKRTDNGRVTATGLDGTVTVRPTAMPAYAARHCGSYEEYFRACSAGGVAAATVTAPAATTTATETVVVTRLGSYLFTKYLGVPFPSVLIPFEIPIASTIATAS
ncbi:hypothetical protein PG985_011463 [Apiospora marii]|uniref:Uncharacterized protein n=1 Tax=Apiospora marii TaxID=335849 RepID=A0ABR1STR6_9PEZI